MIAKHVAMQFASKSAFAGLVAYITGQQGKEERIGVVRVTNCYSDMVDAAMLEILNTQALNTRARGDKTYHLIVSFRPTDTPDDATLKAIEEQLCAGLGLGEHQRISVVHHDTDNLHVHIAINTIHPVRHTIHTPFNDFYALARLCDKLENQYGLEKDNHIASKVASENRADDMERQSAVESLLGWIKRECKDVIAAAQSWEELHQAMREHGLSIHEHANGLVITSNNGVSVKASAVAREFSKKGLESRLGQFAPAAEAPVHVEPRKCYKKRPMPSAVNTDNLYARYIASQHLASAQRSDAWAKAVARKNRLIEDAKRTGRLKRAALRLFRAPAPIKKLMYAATSKVLCDDIAAIKQRYIKEKQKAYVEFKRRTWADWLRAEATAGDKEALAALRARTPASAVTGNAFKGQARTPERSTRAKCDSITKKGTVIYRAGASSVRDCGSTLKVKPGADAAGLESALLMAVDRYGSHLKISGSPSFKEQIARIAATSPLAITFDDPTLEVRRKELANVRPAAATHHGQKTERAAQAAADQYIAEREQKRASGIDVHKHVRFSFASDEVAEYSGIRRINAQALALLKREDKIAVLPVDEATAQRLARLLVGQQISVTAKGVIKTKGRSI